MATVVTWVMPSYALDSWLERRAGMLLGAQMQLFLPLWVLGVASPPHASLEVQDIVRTELCAESGVDRLEQGPASFRGG